MSEAFYSKLRDSTAANIIAAKGRTASFFQWSTNYSPTTGIVGIDPEQSTTLSVQIVTLPVRQGSTMFVEFTKEQMESFEQLVLISAKEFAAAGVSPKAGDELTFDDATFEILGLTAVAPSGIPVIYKAGVSRA